MNITRTKAVGGVAALFACFALYSSALGQTTVYDNILGANYTGKSVNTDGAGLPAGTTEFGDEIGLAGTERVLTSFSIEYFASLVAVAGETGRLRIYANTGPDFAPNAPTPAATPLFDSGTFVLANGFQSVSFPAVTGLTVPDRFTWTLEFAGLGAGESVGLPIYNPPVVGSSPGDFWAKSGGVWSTLLVEGGVTPANFAAQVTAVPEASTILYALVGGLCFLGYRRYRTVRNS